MKDYYAILSVSRSATVSEIRKAYQNLAKQCHPDKLDARQKTDGNAFTLVAEAWSVLSDDESRRHYDSVLAQLTLRQHGPVQDDVQIAEFEEAEDTLSFSYPCRCGGLYEISRTDVDLQVDYVSCNCCSLCIRIVFESLNAM
jgi:diphthamide biosynthesis protein 4